MSKAYKGYEILEAIEKEKIPEGTILLFKSTISTNEIKVVVLRKPEGLQLYRKDDLDILPVSWLLHSKIEIIEEEPEIDIQGIEELEKDFTYYEDDSAGIVIEKVLSKAELELVDRINKLVKAVKQLDNQINNK